MSSVTAITISSMYDLTHFFASGSLEQRDSTTVTYVGEISADPAEGFMYPFLVFRKTNQALMLWPKHQFPELRRNGRLLASFTKLESPPSIPQKVMEVILAKQGEIEHNKALRFIAERTYSRYFEQALVSCEPVGWDVVGFLSRQIGDGEAYDSGISQYYHLPALTYHCMQRLGKSFNQLFKDKHIENYRDLAHHLMHHKPCQK